MATRIDQSQVVSFEEHLMPHDAKHLGKSVAEYEASLTAIGRRLDADEIAPGLAVYLASREASVITGQVFKIDGGLLIGYRKQE